MSSYSQVSGIKGRHVAGLNSIHHTMEENMALILSTTTWKKITKNDASGVGICLPIQVYKLLIQMLRYFCSI